MKYIQQCRLALIGIIFHKKYFKFFSLNLINLTIYKSMDGIFYGANRLYLSHVTEIFICKSRLYNGICFDKYRLEQSMAS